MLSLTFMIITLYTAGNLVAGFSPRRRPNSDHDNSIGEPSLSHVKKVGVSDNSLAAALYPFTQRKTTRRG